MHLRRKFALFLLSRKLQDSPCREKKKKEIPPENKIESQTIPSLPIHGRNEVDARDEGVVCVCIGVICWFLN